MIEDTSMDDQIIEYELNDLDESQSISIEVWKRLISRLRPSRYRIAQCLAYAVLHSKHSAPEEHGLAVKVLSTEIRNEKNTITRLMAQLYVVSDLLFCAKAYRYRNWLEGELPIIFKYLGTLRRNFPGVLSAEAFSRPIQEIIHVWELRRVLSNQAISQLKALLFQTPQHDTKDTIDRNRYDNQSSSLSESSIKGKIKNGPIFKSTFGILDCNSTVKEVDSDIDGELIDLDNDLSWITEIIYTNYLQHSEKIQVQSISSNEEKVKQKETKQKKKSIATFVQETQPMETSISRGNQKKNHFIPQNRHSNEHSDAPVAHMKLVHDTESQNISGNSSKEKQEIDMFDV